MDLSKTRQRYSLATGGGLKSAPSKTSMDPKPANLSSHRWSGVDGAGQGKSHPDYPDLSSKGPGK